MSKIRKIRALLGVKGLLAIASLTTIAMALVFYTASVIMTPSSQFEIGVEAASWTVYVNEQDQVRYLPGDTIRPADGSSTYAFRVTTDAAKTCAVQIQLETAMDSSLFTNFDITVSYWSSSGWTAATLYDSPTGGAIITEIDGTTTNAGYIQQAASTATSYMIEVTYSYDLVDDADPITATFKYTPLPT
jgi:hypothetical protein